MGSETRKRLPRGAYWCLVLALAGAGECRAAAVLYGINLSDNLITIDTATGAGSLVGPLSTSMSGIGLAQRGSSAYVFDTNGGNVLQEIDTTNAATLATVAVGFTGADVLGEGDLAFRADGTGFLVSSLLADGNFDPDNGSFFSLDVGLNSRTLIRDGITQKFVGLAFSPLNGNLYGLTLDGASVYLIDPSDGDVTLVGSTGIASPRCCLGGLSFRPDGALFAALADFGDATLYQINTATGAATMIGDMGFESVSGIAFFDAAAPPPPGVPEPSTGILLVTASLALGARKIYHSRKEA
jgi:DNA-binding beta-propeller fold protein YncE